MFDERLEIVHCYTEIHVPALHHYSTYKNIHHSYFIRISFELGSALNIFIINSAAADKEWQDASLDQRVIETLITWNVPSIVLSPQ